MPRFAFIPAAFIVVFGLTACASAPPRPRPLPAAPASPMSEAPPSLSFGDADEGPEISSGSGRYCYRHNCGTKCFATSAECHADYDHIKQYINNPKQGACD